MQPITGKGLAALLASPTPAVAGVAFVVDGVPDVDIDWLRARLGAAPCLVIGRARWADADPGAREFVDVLVDSGDDEQAITETFDISPLATVALAVHLRAASRRSPADALAAESALYSMLQAGPEFAAWRARTPRSQPEASVGRAVIVEREGDELHVELARPHRRNALNVQMRDELLDALAIAEADPAVRVIVTGQGPSFCAGGDLDEFGTFPDPVTAHVVRLDRSIGAVLARIADRVTAHVHGACYGSGMELPAFAHRVVADPATTFALPELGLGLIPGAGGTASLPARIGRHRTMWLALTQSAIDAETAHEWGLVDEVASVPFS